MVGYSGSLGNWLHVYLFWLYNEIIAYNYYYNYMCVGDDRHCLSTFVHFRRETKKTIFVQAIISTTCLSYEMRFQVFVRDKVFGLLSLTYAGQTLGLMSGSVSMHQLTSAENELL